MDDATSPISPISPAWRAWILEHLAHGLEPSAILERLVAAGAPEPIVRRELMALAHPARLSLASQLRRELAGPTLKEAHGALPSSFWSDHWELNRPLILRGHADAWPARNWSLDGLAARFPDATVEVEVERDPARHFEGRWVERPLATFIADVQARPSNDHYCIARNQNLEHALSPLLKDIVVDPDHFDAGRLVGGSSLWIGPAATLTPLHYDTTNILFVQLVGHKRFWLVSPDWSGLLFRLDGFYVRDDLAAVPPEALHEVVLSPGDALFLPVGWFHRVLALSPSVSFSLLCFRRPNDFSWCHPSRLMRSPTP